MEWKTIEGYADKYEVSDTGLVRNKLKNQLVASYDNHGYRRVILIWKDADGKEHRKQKLVHRLVAETFMPEHPDDWEIDHIDCNKKNNCLSNLRWCSRHENFMNPLTRQHRSQIARRIHTTIEARKKQRMSHIHQSRPVVCLSTGKFYWSVKTASLLSGIPHTTLWQRLNNFIRNPYKYMHKEGQYFRPATPEEIALELDDAALVPFT